MTSDILYVFYVGIYSYTFICLKYNLAAFFPPVV